MNEQTLYHAGFQIIDNPDINFGRKNADFGPGFYLTPNEEFAFKWAKQRIDQSTFVNTYHLDMTNLNIKYFERSIEWFKFIMNNRKGNIPVPNPYDIIIGPIAADIIYDAFGIPTSGFISDEEALKIMSYGQEYQQLVICSEKARAQLTWLDAKKIDEKQLIENREIIERETLSFQAELANILEGTDDSKL